MIDDLRHQPEQGAVGFMDGVVKALLIAFAGFLLFSAVLMVLSLEAA